MDPALEVVITGVGVVSPIGIGADAYWDSLCQRASGVRLIRRYDPTGLPVPFGAELLEFDAKQYVKPRKSLKVMCRELQTAFSASALAIEQATIQPGQVDPDRIGTVFGTEMLYGDVREMDDLYKRSVIDGRFRMDQYSAEFASRMNPLWMLKNLPNMSACHVGIALDARGPNNTIVAGDASGLLALIEAARVIQRGAADMIIVGGSSTRVSLTGWTYRGDLQLSRRSQNPEGASRPFDADRDGMVNGEGAAALVLESRASAESRSAPVLASLVGMQTVMAVRRDIATRRDALQRAIRGCLADAATNPARIGHVNAHGLSTIAEDQAEAEAIRAELGDTPVTAPKSYFGNVGAAGPLVELAASILGMQHDQIPPTLNYETPDPRCPVHVIHDRAARGLYKGMMKLSYSTQGQTAGVVLEVRG